MHVLRAVIFDVDFTIAKPGPDLGPEGYRVLGGATASSSTPRATTRRGAPRSSTLKRHPELDHDEEIWVLLHRSGSSRAWAAAGDTYARAPPRWRARGRTRDHFELYEDALPALDALRARGLKLGLLSNTARDLDEFVAAPRADGRRGSHLTRARQDEAARGDLPRGCSSCSASRRPTRLMVGDTVEDDVEGALAVGMRAVLVDRDGRYPERESIADLRALLS